MMFLESVAAGEIVATTRAGAITEINAVPSRASVVCICCKPAVADGNRIVFPSSETIGFFDVSCAIEPASLFSWHPVPAIITKSVPTKRIKFLAKNSIVFIKIIPLKSIESKLIYGLIKLVPAA